MPRGSQPLSTRTNMVVCPKCKGHGVTGPVVCPWCHGDHILMEVVELHRVGK